MNAAGQITHWNQSAETTFGWRKVEAIGRLMAAVIIPERLRDAHHRGLQRFLESGVHYLLNRRIELSALHRDGREFPVELTIVPIVYGTQRQFFGFLRDLSERKFLEELDKQRLVQLELLYECSLLAQRDIAVSEALIRCLGIICRLTGWEVGHVYAPDPRNPSQLVSSSLWHFAREEHQELAQASAKFTFTLGKGLPGRVWASSEPEWIPNVAQDSNFARAQICSSLGLRSAFAFPVGRDNLHVLEFFSAQVRKPEPHLTLVAKTIAEIMTRVVERPTLSSRPIS